MSQRAEKLLQTGAIHEPLIGALERGDTIFVLSSGTLLYQDSGGTRRVTLRDLTRIHSDQDGLLRVETPAGTALTASLLGFDPVDVQTFFGQVRDTTARIKQAGHAAAASAPQSAAPSTVRPSAGGGGSAASESAASASTDFQESVKVVSAPREPTLIIPAPVATGSSEVRHPTVVTTPPSTPPATVQAAPPPPPRTSVQHSPAQNSGVQSSPRSSASTSSVPYSSGQPVPSSQAAPKSQAAPSTQSSARLVEVPVPTPAPTKGAAPVSVPVSAPVTADLVTEQSDRSLDAAEPESAAVPSALKKGSVRAPQSAAHLLAALAAHAEGVRRWTGRLRFLAVLALLAALALSALQILAGQNLTGIWVLIAGGVSAVALLALADLTKLLVLLACAVSAEAGVIDVD